ncbi:MAG: hypothetical protein HC921_20725 [Synechococcaceae cyanobacterium SM2_3_1]|nr:hypothetical protein [Synechococcaceae cyanobacterium SM2_3_1]
MLTSTFQDLIHDSEGRYLRPSELQDLKTYVDDLPRRIAIYRRLQKQEATLLEKVVTKYKPMHPTLTRQHGAKAWERCHRDLSYVWKYACLAMLLNSEDYLYEINCCTGWKLS